MKIKRKKCSHTSMNQFVCRLAMENYQSLRHHHLRCVVEQLALLVKCRSLKVDENVLEKKIFAKFLGEKIHFNEGNWCMIKVMWKKRATLKFRQSVLHLEKSNSHFTEKNEEDVNMTRKHVCYTLLPPSIAI